jgi:hypothetical protein
MIVALGMVRLGSFTESAGMVADSSPVKAQRVRAAVAVMALEGEEFEDRRNHLHDPGLSHPKGVHSGQEPDGGEGGAGAQGRVHSQDGEKDCHVADESHRDGGIPRPDADPIPPGHQEGSEVPHATAGIGVGPACGRHHPSQPRQHQSDGDGSSGGEEPSENADAAEWRQGRRKEEDARPDHVSHHQSDGEEEPELVGAVLRVASAHPTSLSFPWVCFLPVRHDLPPFSQRPRLRPTRDEFKTRNSGSGAEELQSAGHLAAKNIHHIGVVGTGLRARSQCRRMSLTIRAISLWGQG